MCSCTDVNVGVAHTRLCVCVCVCVAITNLVKPLKDRKEKAVTLTETEGLTATLLLDEWGSCVFYSFFLVFFFTTWQVARIVQDCTNVFGSPSLLDVCAH